MRSYHHPFCWLLLLLCITSARAQHPSAQVIDSLFTALEQAVHDTSRAEILCGITEHYFENNEYGKALGTAAKAQLITQRGANTPAERFAFRRTGSKIKLFIGLVLARRGDHAGALEQYQRSLEMREGPAGPRDIAVVHMHMANAYLMQGKDLQGLHHYRLALAAVDKAKDDRLKSFIHQGLASFHNMQGQYQQALEEYEQCIASVRPLNDPLLLAMPYFNMANVHAGLKQHNTAMRYARESLAIRQAHGDRKGLVDSYGQVGRLFMQMSTEGRDDGSAGPELVVHPHLLDSAQHYMERGMELEQRSSTGGAALDQAIDQGDLARLRGATARAVREYLRAEGIAMKSEMDDKLVAIHRALMHAYTLLGDPAKALAYARRAEEVKARVMDKEKQKEIGRSEARWEYERETLQARKERERAEALFQAQLDQQVIQRNSLVGGLTAMLLLAGAGFRNYQNKRKAYSEVDHQRALLESRNKDITDSIRYAKRIQDAILPSDALFRTMLPDSFILYRPKDIVSGDFYWSDLRVDRVYLAVVDCTGHGVPGALMTMVGNNGLVKAMTDLRDPGAAVILDHLNRSVNESMHSDDERFGMRDGLDISLCVIDLRKRIMRFAAANQLMLLVRDNEVLEYKGDKQPVGAFVDGALKPFSEQELELRPNDRFYLFTDGLMDQFGGQHGKKFRLARLKELLLSVHQRPMLEQRRAVSEVFDAWKGDLEQVDDVCLVGFRVTGAFT